MDLRLLAYFVAVAEERSVTRAAQRLLVAQPSLSQQLRRLEGDLGAVLIDRSVRPLALTPAGARLLADARRLLGLAADSRRAVAALGAGSTGELRLGLPLGGLFELARLALAAMAADRPDIGVTPVLLPDAEAVPAVHDGAVDLAVVRDVGAGLPGGLRSWPLAPEPLLVALPEGHDLARGGTVRLTALSGEPFLTFPRHTGPVIHDRQLAACRAAGFEPAPGPEVDDPQARDLLITLGRGVSLVGAGAAHRFPGVAYLPVDPPVTISHLVAVGRDTAHRPLTALVGHLRVAASEQVATGHGARAGSGPAPR